MNSLIIVLIVIGGLFNLAFAIYHLTFWKVFRWKKDLASISRINRAVMQVLNLCLTFMLLFMAYVSFFHINELVTTVLGNAILIAISLFWFLRMLEQIIFFGLKTGYRLLSHLYFYWDVCFT